MGGIGINGRGSWDLTWMMGEPDVQFVAICDIRKDRREAVKQIDRQQIRHQGLHDAPRHPRVPGGADGYRRRADRHRRPLACAGLHSRDAGRQGCLFREAVVHDDRRRPGSGGNRAASTAGSIRPAPSGSARPNHVFAIETARSGRLGKVHTAYAHIAPWDAAIMGHDRKPAQPEPPKDEVDWDIWLGPCPWRPYNSSYVQGGWRGDYDFHTSCIGEWGAHTFAQAQAGIDALDTSPVALPICGQPHRRRHGHHLCQRREDGPVPR